MKGRRSHGIEKTLSNVAIGGGAIGGAYAIYDLGLLVMGSGISMEGLACVAQDPRVYATAGAED